MGGDHGANFLWQGNHGFATDAHLLTGAASFPPSSPPPQSVPIPPSLPNGGASGSSGSGQSTILLRVSGDHYLGAPAFNVSVDGVQVATGLLAAAVHGQGWADVLVRGDFSLTPGTVAVTFTNDDYGGSTSADRNLYIDYIAVNGIRFEGENALSNTANTTPSSDPGAASLFSYGTVTFATAHVPPSTPGSGVPPVPVSVIPPIPTPAPSGPEIPPVKTIKGSMRSNALTGSAGDDHLFGYGGSDKLKGGSGNDLLSGGWGKDQLWGGLGDDTFVYKSISDSRPIASQDTIHDWGTWRNGRGNDLIDLHSIDANLLRGGNQAFKWIGKAGFSGKAGQLKTYFDGHDTFVQADVNGDRLADFQIKLVGKHALTAGDFLL
jgi:Ca2+-binding RTX toxin-like protein